MFAAVAKHMIAKYGESVAGRYLSKAPPKLMDDKSFWSQVNELWRNFLIIVAVPDKPGTRRVFKMTFESKVEFRRQAKWYLRFAQSMGWRAWRLELFIGGRGGSHHLEVAAPPGVDIIRIRARPRTAAPDRTKAVPDRTKGARRINLWHTGGVVITPGRSWIRPSRCSSSRHGSRGGAGGGPPMSASPCRRS